MAKRAVPVFLVVTASLACGLTPVGAQHATFTFEPRVGLGLPIRGFADAESGWEGEAGRGISFGASFGYAFRRRLVAYAGFSQHRFACPVEGCGRESRFVGTGFDLGGRIILRESGTAVPWLRLGWNTYRLEGDFREDGEAVSRVSDRASGWEGGLGLAIVLTNKVALSPGVRYSAMDPRFSGRSPLGMRYLIVDVGLLIGF